MVERKNIDRVFQENLKDLEIYPSSKVWSNIEQALLENKPKKTIPLWRKLSGVAIIFILFFAGGISYFTFNSGSNKNVKNPVSTATNENTSTEDNTTDITETEISPKVIELAQAEKSKRKPPQKAKSIFIKKPNHSVITTSTDISTIYKTIENKYIVNKEDFLEDIRSDNDEVLLSSNDNPFEIITEEKESNDKKWSVGTTYSPVYYNSLTNGSPINEGLAQNTKSTDDAISLGLKVNYQLTNKINLQSGVNKLELAYNTKNVNATLSSAKYAANNINTDKPGVLLTPSSAKPLENLDASANDKNKANINGDLNQSIEYFEFPLELKYNVFESKVGINVIGGISTYILTNNSVSMVSQNYATSLGEANNLNSVNFSGNFGIDLDYKINSNWYLNVAPMFKYQFNTYTNSSGNFQPYYLGVYSGLNFRF